DESVQIAAIYALGSIGPAAGEAAPKFVKAVRGRGNLSNAAYEMLPRLGPAAVPYLLEMASRDDLRAPATNMLMMMHEEAVPPIADALRSSDAHLRKAAVLAAGTIRRRTPELIPLLRSLLADEDREISSRAASDLGLFGPAAAEAIPDLLKMLKD